MTEDLSIFEAEIETSSETARADAATTGRPTAEQPERMWHQGARHLFDRAEAGRVGHSYVANRETLVCSVQGMTWHEAVEGMAMPHSPGFAVKTLAEVSGLVVQTGSGNCMTMTTEARCLPTIERVAWDGAVPTWDDYEGPGAYVVVGVEFTSGPTSFRLVAVDRGTDLVIAFMEWWTRRRPEWIVTADVTSTAAARVEADSAEEARALGLVALTSDGTDPADVSIAEVERD